MRKFDFWKTDWFLGVAVVIVVILFSHLSDLVPSLERKAYDLGVTATSRAPSDKVVVIAIDRQSIDNIGRWPWSRKVLADMTDKLTAAKAKVIAYTVLFELGAPQGKPDKALPDYVTKNNLANLAKRGEDALVGTRRAEYPIEAFGKSAAALRAALVGEASTVPATTAVDIEL